MTTDREYFQGLGYDQPPVPAGWTDSSWHNDAAASYEVGLLRVWIEHPDRTQREIDCETRFLVMLLEPHEDDLPTIADQPPLLETDDWAEVLAFVEARKGGAQ